MDLDEFVRIFGDALRERTGALFVGSGLSVPSGAPNWPDLLRPLAKSQLGLDLDEHSTLPAIAQWIVNRNNGNRRPLYSRIYASTRWLQPNAYHAAIAAMPVETVWTTNFDTLLETSLAARQPTVRHDDASLVTPLARDRPEVLKLHGCIERSAINDLVVTSGDYEDFFARRPAMARRLGSDLLSRSLVFLGYSLSDPDLATALAEARRMARNNPAAHFIVLVPPRPGEEQLDRLWRDDLRRTGIEVVDAPDYNAVQSALQELARRSRGNTVYVTGSHEADLEIAAEIGAVLAARDDVVLLDGQSQGVGRRAVNAFCEVALDQRHELTRRLETFLNPYSIDAAFAVDPTRISQLQGLRAALLRRCSVLVCLPGGLGTAAEVKAGIDLGCRIVPVPQRADDSAFRLLSDPSVQQGLSDTYIQQARRLSVDAIGVRREVDRFLH